MRDAGGPAIELRGVTVRERRQPALEAIDLIVASGQAASVVGPNGSGKSTLLRVVAGLCRPSRGVVRVGGWDLLERPERVRRLIGYVAAAPGLAERLTPAEHLALTAAQRGLGHAEAPSTVESMLDLVDLGRFASEPIGALSPGQRRRLAIALALVHDPPIILVDEPAAGLDEVGRGELISVLLELRSMGKTLLIASQSPTDVAEVSDLILSLVAGRLTAPESRAAAAFTWLEVVGDVERALRSLRETPSVEDLRRDGTFITIQGPSTPEERAHLAARLIAAGIQLAGFGVTSAPAGGTPE